jgi:acyl dehydratase
VSDHTLAAMPGLAGLYAKAVGGRLPLIGPKLAGRPAGGDAEPPAYRVSGVELDRERLARYRTVCGFARGDDVPATYPEAVAFPLVLALITDPAFPFPPLGAVHIGNSIWARRPLRAGDRLDLRAALIGAAAHPRGRQASVLVEAHAPGADGEPVWTAVMDLLHRERSPAADADAAPPRTLDLPEEPPSGPQLWRLPSDLGRRYAAVTGDRNPIHLSDLTARPFGLRRHIAHGMWTHARALAEIENRLPNALTVDVAFKRPIGLPATVRFGARALGDRVDFGVSAPSGEPHLVGRARPL